MSSASLYLPVPGESLLKTHPEWMSFLASFSLCFGWDGKTVLNIMICLLHEFDVCMGLRH